MMVPRLAEGGDSRVPYARMATAEQDTRERLRAEGVEFTAVRAIWTPANDESDVHLEVWHGSRAEVMRP